MERRIDCCWYTTVQPIDSIHGEEFGDSDRLALGALALGSSASTTLRALGRSVRATLGALGRSVRAALGALREIAMTRRCNTGRGNEHFIVGLVDATDALGCLDIKDGKEKDGNEKKDERLEGHVVERKA